MTRVGSETDIHDFYRRWSPQVCAFCRLFLGDPSRAEEATARAFLAYVERDLDLDFGELPDDLLRFAWEAGKHYDETRPSLVANGRDLGKAILLLPFEERAVFILRSVMGMDELDVGTVLDFPLQKVRETWMRALLELRRLLPTSFFGDRANHL